MAITPPLIVPAPEPRGLRYGLFAVANGPVKLMPHGAAGGLTYDPVSCGEAHWYDTPCHGDIRYGKIFDENNGWITADPFLAYASLRCGSAGTNPAELEAKVMRRLANGEQTIAEFGLATALAAGAIPLITPVTASITAMVAELEQWLYGIATANYGNVGYLHAPPRFAAYAADADLLIQDGPLLRTRMGTIWIFGGGYPDDGRMYISGQVTVWRSDDVFVSPATSALNLMKNEYRMLAEREYAVAYDCVAASVESDWLPIS
jgi:hypothetical protein